MENTRNQENSKMVQKVVIFLWKYWTSLQISIQKAPKSNQIDRKYIILAWFNQKIMIELILGSVNANI